MQKNIINPQEILKLASEAANNAYVPFSSFYVGACAVYDDGTRFPGCNVENSSYGLTLCAERNAISSAVANGKKKGLVAIAIYSPNKTLCYPCGACRQWISEFSKNAQIILEGTDGNPVVTTISKLLPHSFEL